MPNYSTTKIQNHRIVHIDHVTEWLLGRPQFQLELHEWLRDNGYVTLGRLSSLSYDTIGFAVSGTSDRTHTRFSKWFDTLVLREIRKNDFLSRPGLPLPHPDARFNSELGRFVSSTEWWKENATRVRQAVNRNKATREVLDG